MDLKKKETENLTELVGRPCSGHVALVGEGAEGVHGKGWGQALGGTVAASRTPHLVQG